MSLFISAETIVKYENIGLWVLFGVVIGALLIAILRGAFRGWAYGTYRLAFFVIVIVVLFATMTPTVNALGNFNLARWVHQAISFDIDGKNVSADISTLYGTINDLIKSFLQQFAPEIDSNQIISVAATLTLSLLKFLLIFIEGILLAIVGTFLCWLLWHIAFKHFIPKARRKQLYKKGRIFSIIEEVVVVLLVGAMVVLPITSVLNSVASNFEKPETEAEDAQLRADNQTYNLIRSVADTYENSVFSKAFFSWTKDANGNTWDVKLMNYFTNVVGEDIEVAIVDTLGDAARIGSLALESGLLSSEGTMFDKIYLFLSSTYGPKLVSAVANTKLITGLLPLALQIGSNFDMVKDYLGNNLGIDYYAYNWQASIQSIADMITDLQASDVFTFFTDVDGAPAFDTDHVASLFTENTKEKMHSMFARLKTNPEEQNLFNDMISVVLVNMALNAPEPDPGSISISSFLPSTNGVTYETEESGRKVPTALNEAYSNIDVANELTIVYDALCDMNDLDDRITPLILDAAFDENHEFDTDALIDIALDDIVGFSDIIAGNATMDADPTKTCLMDSLFLTYAMPGLLDFGIDSANSALEADFDISDVKDELFAETLPFQQLKANAKAEMRSILKVARDFVDETKTWGPTCKAFIKDLNGMPGITFNPDDTLHSIDSNLLDGFISVARNIDSSDIFEALVPQVAEKYLSDLTFLQDYGITELHFDIDNFGNALGDLLVAFRDCQPLITYLMNFQGVSGGRDLYNAIHGLAPFADNTGGSCQLMTLLNGIVSNPILDDSTHSSYKSLLQTLGRMITGDDTYEITVAVNPAVENEVLCDFIYALTQEATPDLLAVVDGGSVTMAQLKAIHFENLLTPLSSSDVFGDIIATFLDDMLEPLLFSGGANPGVSFKNVTDWTAEGQALDTLIRYAAEIGDIANIDFFSSDPYAIAGILECLATNEIFQNGNDYLFGQFLYDTLSEMGGEVLSFFYDRGATTTNQLHDDIVALSRADWTDESANFGDVVHYIQLVVGEAGLGGTISLDTIDAKHFGGLLNKLSYSRSIGRTLSYHLFEQIVDSLIDGGIDLGEGTHGAANLDFIWDAWDNGDRTTLLRDDFARFADVVDAVTDPSYGILNSSGLIDASNLDLTSVSGHYLVDPFLRGFATSYIFNTLPDGATGLTSFESIIVSMIDSSQLYGPSSDPTTLANIRLYVRAVCTEGLNITQAKLPGSTRLASNGPWVQEVNRLADAVDAFRNLDIDLNNLDVSTMFRDEYNQPLPANEAEAKRLAFRDVLSAVNDSKLLYRALPDKVKDALDSASASIGVTAVDPNYYYMGQGITQQPYGDDEIDTLSYLIMDTGSADLTISDLADLDKIYSTDLLQRMAMSHVTNSIPSGSSQTETFFSAVMVRIFNSTGLDDSYFYANNPKDQRASLYTDAESKVRYYVAELFPALSATDLCTDEPNLDVFVGDSHSFRSLIDKIQTDEAAYAALNSGNVETMTAYQIALFGKELCPNPLLSDTFVNPIAKMFDEEFGSMPIVMENANPYYMYWLGNAGMLPMTNANANYDAYMDDAQIEILAEAAVMVNENETLFNDIEHASFDDDTILFLRDFLSTIQSSYVLHLGGVWDEFGTRTYGTASWKNAHTVFEQAYGLILEEATLSDRNYNNKFDVGYADASEKLSGYISAFNAGTLASDHAGNWLLEIYNLTDDGNGAGFMKVAQSLGFIDSTGLHLDSSSMDFESMPPASLSSLLKALSKLDVIKEMVPYEMIDLFQNEIEFDDYTTYRLSLSEGTDLYDSSVLGAPGLFRTLYLDNPVSYEVSVSYDGATYSAYTAVAGGPGITFDLDNARAFRLKANGANVDDFAVSIDTMEYFLDQAGYYEDDGGVDSLTAFLDFLYTLGGGSYPDIHAGDPVSTNTLAQVFGPLMAFLNDPNGFFTMRYLDGAVSANGTYEARDVTFRNLLLFTYRHEMVDYELDLARYFADPTDEFAVYENIGGIFEDANFDSDIEGQWFTDNLAPVESVELILNDSIGSVGFGEYHNKVEALAHLKDGSDYTITKLFDASDTLFGVGITDGMFKDFFEATIAYADDNTQYFNSGINPLTDPGSSATRMSENHAQSALDNYGFLAFPAASSVTAINGLNTLLSLTENFGLRKLASTDATVRSNARYLFNEMQTEMATNSADLNRLIAYFYDAVMYDYMVNRNYYTSTGVDYPCAFRSGFSYADVASAIPA